MNNYMLIGVNNFTNFNLKLCLGVLTFFSVLTIISYVAEVNNHGTYMHWFSNGKVHKRFRRSFHDKKTNVHFALTTTVQHGNVTSSGAHGDDQKYAGGLATNGQEQLTAVFRSIASYNRRPNGEIEKHTEAFVNGSRKAFIRNLNRKAITGVVTRTSPQFSRNEDDLKSREIYTRVVFHISDPIVIPFRDCLQRVEQVREKLGRKLKRQDHTSGSFSVKYNSFSGRLIFSTNMKKHFCEENRRTCSKFFIVSHPVRRLVTLFELCKNNRTLPEICQKEHFRPNITFYDFAKVNNGILFRKLLRDTKVCQKKLKPDICALLPNKIQLWNTAYDRYLKVVIRYIAGFKGVGLMEQPQITLLLFQKFLGLNLTKCKGLGMKLPYVGDARWKNLLNDAKLRKLFEVDLMVYRKFEQIFSMHRQELLNITTTASTGRGQLLKPTSQSLYHKKMVKNASVVSAAASSATKDQQKLPVVKNVLRKLVQTDSNRTVAHKGN